MSAGPYNLFLDDERAAPWWLNQPLTVRDVSEMKDAFFMFGVPDVISFDHDLGSDDYTGLMKPSGHDALKWLIEQHLDGVYDLTRIQKVYVHSMNPAGAINIVRLWDNFAENIGSPVKAERKLTT